MCGCCRCLVSDGDVADDDADADDSADRADDGDIIDDDHDDGEMLIMR